MTTTEHDQQERLRLAVGVLGLVTVLAFTGACILIDRARGSEPALVRVTSVERSSERGTPLFTVEIENAGDVTAQQVQLRVEVPGEDPVDHTVDFLAPGERDDATFPAPAGTTQDDVETSVRAWTSAQ